MHVAAQRGCRLCLTRTRARVRVRGQAIVIRSTPCLLSDRSHLVNEPPAHSFITRYGRPSEVLKVGESPLEWWGFG